MRLGCILRKYRLMNEQGVREIAKAIGISAATFSRFERGEMPDGRTLALILRWALEEMP